MERVHGTIFNGVRTVLTVSGLPKWLWGEAVNYCVYVYNRTMRKFLGGKTPFEARFGIIPDLSGLHPWGIPVMTRIEPKSKLDDRAIKGNWVGLDPSSKGHCIYWPTLHKVSVERNVVFLNSAETPSVKGEHDVDIGPIDNENDTADPPVSGPIVQSQHEKSNDDKDDTPDKPEPTGTGDAYEPQEPADPLIISGKCARKPGRIAQAIARGDGTATYAQEAYNFELWENALLKYASALTTTVDPFDPRTVGKAKKQPDWLKWNDAMKDEIRRLESCKSWIYADHPGPGVNIINCKWVFRAKRDAKGQITGYRARLVACGYTQIEGVDFDPNDLFMPTCKAASWRTLLSVAATNGWKIHQMDIKSAYLYGKLTEGEVVYMRPPSDITLPGLKPGQVLRLIVTLYGLKQAGRRWYNVYHSAMNFYVQNMIMRYITGAITNS